MSRLASRLGSSVGGAATWQHAGKLRVGAVDDPLEDEADRVAAQVMGAPAAEAAPGSPSAPSGGEMLRREPGGTLAVSVAAVQAGVGGSDQPLDAGTRAYFEPRLGQDFGHVRVHADEAAARAALSLGAAAYTVGRDVVFGAGRYAPATSTGRRLIAHELAHVAQQRRTGPIIQREPLPQYKAADQVTELRVVYRPDESDVWVLAVKNDFPTPEAVGRLIWPTRQPIPPGVSIKRVFGMEVTVTKPAAASSRETVFELSGIARFTLSGMDPSIAQLFRDQGLIEESQALREARAAFRKRHADLGVVVLGNIDSALDRVTRSNPDLLEAYYRRYADWPLGANIESTSGAAGDTDLAITKGGKVSDINVGVLNLKKLPQLPTDDRLSMLGSTLIHEFAHTSHASDPLKGPGEGKAYGIENFFNERMGDKTRDDETLKVGKRRGDATAFDAANQVMKFLYQVIDGQTSKLPSLAGVTRQRARTMAVEFVSKNKADFSAELKAFIRTEFDPAYYGSLP